MLVKSNVWYVDIAYYSVYCLYHYVRAAKYFIEYGNSGASRLHQSRVRLCEFVLAGSLEVPDQMFESE